MKDINDIAWVFSNIKTQYENGKPYLHKPILLILALGHCYIGKGRMIPFSVIDMALKQMFSKFYPIGLERSNTHYPFGKLENDKLWEIEKSAELQRTSVGHLFRSELLEKNIHGGFTQEIYQSLINNKALLLTIADQILQRYFPPEQHAALRAAVGLPETAGRTREEGVNDFSGSYWSEGDVKARDSAREHVMETQENGFIAYLNSLHNVGASGANALAESQALNRYFAELYEPFPLVDAVVKALTDGQDRVVVLTGHAGDGKSTVALDVLKRLRKLPANEPLDQALDEREVVQRPSGQISIVKDMSELSARIRLRWLEQGFYEPGSWLIVSNTGPLLNSLAEFSRQRGVPGDIESEILRQLDQPYAGGDLGRHTLSQFPKDLIILNMTRLDNVALGARVLTRMVNHSAWDQCSGCSAEHACPLRLNRQALQVGGNIVEDRVRWVYQRLTAYEQRLTLRQMVAHLALSLTGGMSCEKARNHVATSAAEGMNKGTDGLEQILFSEGFFGYSKGKPWRDAEGLRAVALVRRLVFGGPVAVDFERRLSVEEGMGWARLPDVLSGLNQRWRTRASESTGVRWRFAQRRMIYLFGQEANSTEPLTEIFLDSFLQSPQLRDFDRWQREEQLTLSPAEQNRLRKACLRVLLEIYSGFSAGQFQPHHDRLYLTLRRPDRAVVQPTQLVVAALSFQYFDLHYDPVRRLPLLRFSKNNAKVELELTLPLLDYIQRRHVGELGSELAQIHLAQLEWFRAELLRAAGQDSRSSSEIGLLRAGIDGEVHLHRYLLDEVNQRLERE